MSDDEESRLDPSDPETQFIPQEDDDETLWEVIDITAEKGKLYKVRWKGIDPKTQKPWPQSWVAKHDCTDDLVEDWKLRQAKKKKASTRDPRKSRSSIATVKSSGSGLTSKTRATPSKFDSVDSTRRSTSTTTAVTTRRGRSKATIPSPSVDERSTRSHNPLHTPSRSPVSPIRTSPSPGLNANAAAASSTSAKTGAKRKHGETTSATTSSRIPSGSTFPTAAENGPNSISGSVPPPRKKRKLEVEVVNNYEHSASSAEVNNKKRRQKVSSRAISSDDDDDDYSEVKLESDGVVELGPKHSKLQRRDQSQPAEEEEEEADERMVQESLSDMYYSPRPISPQELSHNQEEEGTPTPPVRVPAHTRQDTAEESTPMVSRPQHERDSSPSLLPRTSSKFGPPSKKGTRTSSPPSSGAATESRTTTKYRILNQVARSKTTSGESKRKNAVVSKQEWEELNDFQSQQVTERGMAPGHDESEKGLSEEEPDLELMALDYPVEEELPPPPPPPPPLEMPVPDQASRSRAESASSSGSHSLSEHVTKSIPPPIPRSEDVSLPGPSATPSTGIVMPTTSPINKVNGANDEGHRSPILSPRAQNRLKQFDRILMKIELRKEREKEQRLEDGAILDKVQKSRERERKEEKDGEMAVAGGSGRQEQVRTLEEKNCKGKERDQTVDKAQGASTSKPPEIETKKKMEPLFLPDDSDFETAVRPKNPDHGKRKSKSTSISKETSQPPNPVLRSYESDSDTNPQARLEHQERAEATRQKSKSGSKERGKEQLNQRLPSHHASDSDSEPGFKSRSKWKTPRHKPVTRKLAYTNEEAEQNKTSSTRVSSANPKLTDREISKATSKTVSKPTSKPQSEVGTSTAQARPPASTTTVRRSANPRSNSFVNDIIPESEESQSRSQEIKLQVPVPSHLPVPPTTPSSKFTLKSRMKPKTPQPKSRPLSRTSSAGALALGVKLDLDMGVGNDVDNNLNDRLDDVDEAVKKISKKKVDENGATTKLFGPIPRISPSAFRAHFPSSLPESIIESTEGDGDDAAKRVTDRNEEDDSIEQFESPKKDSTLGEEKRIGVLNATTRQEREKQRVKESASDIWNSDINRRGQELAEAARKREKERLRTEEKSALPLTKSIPQAKNTASGYLVTEKLNRLPPLQEEEMNPGVSMQSLPPNVVLPPQESVVQQMEDAYVDLSGGVHEDHIAEPATVGASTSAMAGIEGSQSIETELTVDNEVDVDVDMDTEMGTGIVEHQVDPIHLRQEEEESTQDLMMELLYQQQQGIGVGKNGALVPEATNDTGDLPPAIQMDSQPISEAMLDKRAQKRNAGNEKSDRFLDEIPSIIVENPSRASLARSYSSLEDGDGLSHRKARSRKSRSRSCSVSSQKSKNEKEPDPEAEIPATASTHRASLQALSQPADSQTESAENPHHLGAAMHLLNIKSEEIFKLEDQLSAEQLRNEDLLQQVSALQLHLTESTDDALSASAIKTLEQELAETRAQLALQTASWEKEREALVLNIQTATRGKVSAEQDRDFFREQYAKASGFVTSVRDENAELEKQIKIATDQTQSGVSLIKATFELRTKSLEEDVRAWRRMAEFLMDKDRRTNDHIRRRAAEEPELRARCDRQEGALEDISERLLQLEMDLEEKQRMFVEAEETGKAWEELTVKLNLELNEAKTKLERIGKIGIGDGDEIAHPNGHEFVYRCQWRPDDSKGPCEAVFLNISELREHLHTGGHLQLD